MRTLPSLPGSVNAAPRVLAGAASLTIAALAVVEAPTWPLFLLALGATEWGHLVALAGLTLAMPIGERGPGHRLGSALGLGAAALASSPLLRAARYATSVPEQIAAAFGSPTIRGTPAAPPRPAPFVAADLLRGVPIPPVRQEALTYAEHAGEELSLELYYPPHPDGPTPCVVVVHAGSWQHGSRLECQPFSRYLASHGYVVASIDYRLLPRHRFPAAQEDVAAAIAYLKGRAGQLGIDRERFVLLGRSAGGQIALTHAYAAADPAVRGVISFYAPTDLRYGYVRPSRTRVIDCRGICEEYLGGRPHEVPERYDAAAPIASAGPGAPPTLLIHGARDEVVGAIHGRILAAALAQARRPHLLLELPWATHGMDYNLSGPGGQISVYAVERFLAAVTEQRTDNR